MRIPTDRSRPMFRPILDTSLLIALSVGALYATASLAFAPDRSARGVAVVFAPWVGADDAFRKTVDAGARFVRFGGPSFVTVAVPDSDDFISRIRKAGALLVADPQAVEACLRAVGAGTAR